MAKKKKKDKLVTLTDKPDVKVLESECYRAINGRYYTDKDAYEEWYINNLYREKSINVLTELLGYESGMKIPGILFKKLKELDGYNNEALYLCIMDKSEAIKWAIDNKEFKNEISRICYIMAIINNNIYPYHKAVVKRIKARKLEAKNEVTEEDIIIENKVQKTRDVSKWLEE